MNKTWPETELPYKNILDKLSKKPGFFRRLINAYSIMKKPAMGLVMRFYKDTIDYGIHGTLCASSNVHGISNEIIPFVFLGITNPPKMTIDTLKYIIEEARHYGYNVHYLSSYGITNQIKTLPQIYRNTKSNEPEIVTINSNNKYNNKIKPYLKSAPLIQRVK